ncbi:hypothetical protein [Shewanella sp. SR44-3]|uniref:hypothetical protein n=1 Tax=unclassified Shewanella TaxID=196818 RepID=UPI0015FD412E|nr:hypothetical protein [Shewanella sp. SR44-3]MBB1269041.1 hypothetical protein [Shewanella sp. SR44-3]
MQQVFAVEIQNFKKVSKLPNAWSNEDYHALMALMELDEGLEGMDATELREMCMMSLSDLEPAAAAKVVLTHQFSEELAEGKIDQLSYDLAGDRMWEEYSDCQLHHKLFSCYALLREAFNGIFAEPTGVIFSVKITADADALTVFDEPPHAAMVRLLAVGLSPDALMHRLYEDQLSGEIFEEATGILWQCEQVSATERSREFSLISSAFWFAALEGIDDFSGQTHKDAQPD